MSLFSKLFNVVENKLNELNNFKNNIVIPHLNARSADDLPLFCLEQIIKMIQHKNATQYYIQSH